MDKALAIQRTVMDILGTEHVYLVGGSVRDIVMGNTPKDYDFCTPLLPDEMEAKIVAAGRHPYGIGKKFGTMGFKVPYEAPATQRKGKGYEATTKEVFEYVEVTTFRSEIYTSKSRKPEVQFVPNLDEDLARRDFTFNAMVLKPDGTIYDPYGGKLDIHAKMIKTVGAPKDRIQEDPLRMLRAARFVARYGFTIDVNFIGKARQLADRIYDVSVERWIQEMDKLLVSNHYGSGLKAMEDMGLLYRILPELQRNPNETIGPKDVDTMWKQLLKNTGDSPQMTKYINGGICLRLKFSNDRSDIIVGRTK